MKQMVLLSFLCCGFLCGCYTKRDYDVMVDRAKTMEGVDCSKIQEFMGQIPLESDTVQDRWAILHTRHTLTRFLFSRFTPSQLSSNAAILEMRVGTGDNKTYSRSVDVLLYMVPVNFEMNGSIVNLAPPVKFRLEIHPDTGVLSMSRYQTLNLPQTVPRQGSGMFFSTGYFESMDLFGNGLSLYSRVIQFARAELLLLKYIKSYPMASNAKSCRIVSRFDWQGPLDWIESQGFHENFVFSVKDISNIK